MEARFSAPVQTGPGAHPASCTMGTGSFPGVKSGRGVTLTPHPLLVPWSRKNTAIPLLPLWTVRPVQSLNALQGCTLPYRYQLIRDTKPTECTKLLLRYLFQNIEPTCFGPQWTIKSVSIPATKHKTKLATSVT